MRAAFIIATLVIGYCIGDALHEYDDYAVQQDTIDLLSSYISESCAAPQLVPEQEI